MELWSNLVCLISGEYIICVSVSVCLCVYVCACVRCLCMVTGFLKQDHFSSTYIYIGNFYSVQNTIYVKF